MNKWNYRHIPNYQNLEPNKVKEQLRNARIAIAKQFFKNDTTFKEINND